jgi:adenine-specific DNA-methyltransferase
MFDKAYNQVKQLVEDFKASESHFLSATYSEAEVRKDFIDKFFTILGWDVDHHFQKNPFQQEVKVEKAQRQEGHQSQKRADYAFSLAPDFKRTLFFVEAKKPSRLLRQNKDDYFQTAKYGWNSQTGISILTDFQELVIIDCRFKPDFDTILKNEIKYYRYEDYANEDIFSEIYWLFSREAVVAGNLTTFIESLQKPKAKEKQLKLSGGKYQSIDESFLNYIDDIRLQMAQAFHANNPTLDYYDLTEATQRTIDRLVFIRFLEDKQIEPEDLMHSISTANYPWQKFIEISKRLDAKYNGVVFKEHFIDKKAFLGADEELFRSIAADLDHTNTPYDFNYIPIHILGNIYERFLGKIIVIENGKASIELKPEVRKAGGVFYTPKYIVDYIVENTVGKLIADKKPKEIAKLTFADIACGSGSFLIGVFDYLLDYHKNYYNEHTDEAEKEGCKYDAEKGVWTMSINQKKQILINNVYGVDIDLQATEVTQVSLFLKLLEDETMGTVAELNQLFVADKILPDLSNNIKCGNSLIGTEIMADVLDFGRDEMRKLNPFDFETAFPNVFRKGGFDAIVGNPPYVFTRDGGFLEIVKDYYKKNYFEEKLKTNKTRGSQSGKANLYALFLLKGKNIINKKGILSYIIPNTFLRTTVYETTRKSILDENNIFEIVDLKDGVFKDVTASTIIITIGRNDDENIKVIDNPKSISFIIKEYHIVNKKVFKNSPNLVFNILSNEKEQLLKNKLISANDKLSNYVSVFNGIATFKDKQGISKTKENENFKKILTGKDISRYSYEWKGLYIEYIREKLLRARDEKIFNMPEKLIMQRIGGILVSTIDVEQYYTYNSVNNLLLKGNTHISLKFILAILNSKLLIFYYKKFVSNNSSLTVNISKTLLDELPIPKITSENQQLHDDLVKLVEQMLKAKKEEQNAQSDHEKNLYKNLTESLDYKINNLVYKLYNLTPEEIDLVENS